LSVKRSMTAGWSDVRKIKAEFVLHVNTPIVSMICKMIHSKFFLITGRFACLFRNIINEYPSYYLEHIYY